MLQERISRAVDTVDRRVGTGAPPIPGRPRGRGLLQAIRQHPVETIVGGVMVAGTAAGGGYLATRGGPSGGQNGGGSPDSSHSIVGAAPSLSPEVSASGVTASFPTDIRNGAGGEMSGVGSGTEIAVNLPPKSPEPTPIPTQAPTPSPVRTESPPPITTQEPTTPPEVLKGLDKTLHDWVSRKLKVKNSQRFVDQATGPGAVPYYQRLEMVSDSLEFPPLQGPLFSGFILGGEVVDDHLVFYIGQEDPKGNQYFFPITVGPTSPDPRDPIKTPYEFRCKIDPDNTLAPTGTITVGAKFKTSEGISLLNQINLKAVMFNIYGEAVPISVGTPSIMHVNLYEEQAQASNTKAFYTWSFDLVKNKRSYKSKPSPIPINQRIKAGTFDESVVPWVNRLRVNAHK